MRSVREWTRRLREGDLDCSCDAGDTSRVEGEKVVVTWNKDTTVVGQSCGVLCTAAGDACQWNAPLVTVDRVCDATNTDEDELGVGGGGGDLELATNLDASRTEGGDSRACSSRAVFVEEIRGREGL